MPQLDIVLWFSQIFWLLIFFVLFISFIFILYIPLSCYVEDLPNLKKIDHISIAIFFNFFYLKDLQEFISCYENIR